ncbi:MAG TPA: SUMF1/EgtB/PvdO family nonheme iron enzyme [Pirellulales bacterium]|jgi:hypothetical protein|nr:SUMF1/EgtB/PvdO family nonheme iron enzyme [Pirellulales bacterium]
MPRLVQLNTVPSGAKVAFAPLTEDGNPIANRLVVSGNSPVKIKLLPGDYWVEALLPDGRFHEVRRRVPTPDEIIGSTTRHLFWKLSNGTVLLPDIQIPSKEVNQQMVLVTDTDDSKGTQVSKSDNDEALKPFYVDTQEITAEEYLKVKHDLILDLKNIHLQNEQPIPLKYDDAVEYAEAAGKRLPTVKEWQLAQLKLAPRTLNSLAKWTSTSVSSPSNVSSQTGQIACGGTERLVRNLANLTASDYAPNAWIALRPNQFYSSVGIRCVQ